MLVLAFCFVVGSGFEFCYNCCSAASTFVAVIVVAAAILFPVVVLVTALLAAVVHVLAVVQNGLVYLVVATSKWHIHLPVRNIIQCFLRSMSQHILFAISPCPPPPRPARHRPARGSRTGWSGSPRTCGSEEG